ncbi:MAG TPA: inositol monophosphatase family protein [Candidatus Aminicenantes bacterium]|nr:inositol monophosphatase family protein [Candidatus Aminicenantes bacterium]
MTTDPSLPSGAAETALDAAIRAGELIRQRFRTLTRGEVSAKGRNDFVTAVDRQSEQIIVSTLRDRFPAHRILAEEGGDGGADAGPFHWVIDPLDGTTNFIQGIPVCAVSLALRREGRTVLGVVHNPFFAETYLAVRGRGASRNGEPLRCTSAVTVEGALGATGFPFKAPAAIPAYLRFFGGLLPRVKDLRRCGAAALDLAYTAAGSYDFFFEAYLLPWDFMAGALLIEEAGGTVSDFSGGPLGLAESSVLAAGPGLHPPLLEETRAIFAGQSPL